MLSWSYTNLKTEFYIILIAIFIKQNIQTYSDNKNEYQNSGPYQIYEATESDCQDVSREVKDWFTEITLTTNGQESGCLYFVSR